MFKYREYIAQIKYKEVISSPVYFIPVLLLAIMIIIEGFHIFNHKQNCKTKAIKQAFNTLLSDEYQDKALSLGFIPLKGNILLKSRAAVEKIGS